MEHRPTKAEIAAAVGSTVPDLVAPGLAVLFCGINPGLYSGATRHHFARPGNRFWPTLRAAGFTDRLVRPWEERRILDYGLGITNLVARATATAAELGRDELRAGRERLVRKVRRFRPKAVAILGIGAYRLAFGNARAVVGRQPAMLGQTLLWVLPNPSGLNASHQLPDLARAFRELREAVSRPPPSVVPPGVPTPP
jgi:TDG/mug DNA glycosylase family protein